MLHVAPEKTFETRLRRAPRLDYITADMHDPRAMVRMDITSIPFEQDSFDVILCSHVLEHVPDDRQAMREFHRVLRSTGRAILQVPIERDVTDEDPSAPEAERVERFGQADHVRSYGPDIADRLRDVGFGVEVLRATDCLTAAELEQQSVPDNEMLFCCSKGQI